MSGTEELRVIPRTDDSPRVVRPAVREDPIPFSLPDLGSDEKAAVLEAIDSGWVTSGPQMKAFEDEFAAFVGGGVDAVATNSATAGLHLALEACGIGPGDEVIVPTWTFTATAEVVRYLGARPVLVDIDPVTLNIDPARLEAAITSQTRAIMPVHMAGLSADMPAIAALARPRGIKIIEDAAHALPTSSGGHTVGSLYWSDAAAFSFYANKTITTGEGGMVTTRDPAMAARMRTMRLHGIDRDVFNRYRSSKPAWGYDVVAPGFKYNMPDTAAAMGRVQLRRAHELRDRRQLVVDRYMAGLSDLPLVMPPRSPAGELHAWHLFIIQVGAQANVSRDQFIMALADRGIATSVHFIPLHHLSYWRSALDGPGSTLPRADSAASRTVSLPLYSKMSQAQVARVIATVREVLE